MKKFKLLSLIGITSLALAQVGWAAGRGGGGGGHGGGGGGGGFGGGGFHGGGFGGGGFHGGGFRGGGFGGGVGMRGGGVGFGVARSPSSAPNFAGAGSRFSSFGHPSSRQPVFDGRPNRSVPSNVARNRDAMVSAARPSRIFPQRGLNGRTDHIAERHNANWHRDWDRRHAHFDHGHFFVFDDGFWFGLDPGFFPWDYLPYDADDYYPYDYYADDQSYDNTDDQSYGDTDAYNNGVPAPDPTVEATQERLGQLGYYNDQVDGVFGPSTRDAVAKYQIANQLNVTGSLSPDTLQSLGLPQPAAS
jgi:hypothetical protein